MVTFAQLADDAADLVKVIAHAIGNEAAALEAESVSLIEAILMPIEDIPKDFQKLEDDYKESGISFSTGRDAVRVLADIGRAVGGALAFAGAIEVVGTFLFEEYGVTFLGSLLEDAVGDIEHGLGAIIRGGAIAAASGKIHDAIDYFDEYINHTKNQIAALPPLGPSILVPEGDTTSVNDTIQTTGVSINDPLAHGDFDFLKVYITADSGSIQIDNLNGITIAGSGTDLIQMSGSLEHINFDLATLMYTAGSVAGTAKIAIDVVDLDGKEGTASFDVTVQPNTTPPPPSGPVAVAWGDVHLTTFDGLLYNFQAVGEFVLAEATQPGDSYQIQIRLQPYGSSTSVSVMTEIAAAVGTDRVTFDLNRPDTVWVDGAASTLSAADPTVTLNGGTLTELSSDQYEIAWNTGETLTVTDYGSFLGITTALASSEGPDSVKGLLGSDTGTANDFQLADGTVLPQPLTFADLYGEFANAWRLTQPTSLLDYGTGQTTATFTNLNFPYQSASLSDFSPTLVAQAAQLVAAAGITDPNVAAAAELDYLETNDNSFITGAAAASQAVPTTTPAQITPPYPTELSGFLTVDNEFSLYISTSDSTLGTLIASGSDWQQTYSFGNVQLSADSPYYLHVVAINTGGPDGFIGSFSLSGSSFEFSNGSQTLDTETSDWNAATISDTATWVAPAAGGATDEGQNGVGPWGEHSSIDPSAQWIWSNPTVSNAAFFSTEITPVTQDAPLFTGLSADINNQIINSFLHPDTLDLTDMDFTRQTDSWDAQAGGGLLIIGDGTHSAAITFTGDLALNSFTFASDGTGGTLIGHV